jgi:hypothetical protein
MTPRSWNTHAILTRAAFVTAQAPWLHDSVPVVSLKDFLAESRGALTDLLKTYWMRLASKTGASSPDDHPEEIRRAADLVRALRLNPDIGFPSVRLMLASEIDPETPHDMSRKGPPGGMYLATCNGESMEVLEVIATFSDEPDWGMDQDLFQIEEYQYGPCPYGLATGKSSQAPFHMAFLHESPLLTSLAPGLRVSFMEDRIRTFFELAKLAFRIGIDYWGWRFSAWAMHYLQDLTQPYHASPFPVPLIPILKRFIEWPHFGGLLEANKNYLKSRHLLFEAIIHFLMNDAAKRRQGHAFFEALRGRGEIPSSSLKTMMEQASKIAKALARPADRALAALVNLPKIGDPAFSLEEDSDFKIHLLVPSVRTQRPKEYEGFVNVVAACLRETGKVTRYAIMSSDR